MPSFERHDREMLSGYSRVMAPQLLYNTYIFEHCAYHMAKCYVFEKAKGCTAGLYLPEALVGLQCALHTGRTREVGEIQCGQ